MEKMKENKGLPYVSYVSYVFGEVRQNDGAFGRTWI